MAQREGFEPSVPLRGTHDFQSCSLGRSDISANSFVCRLRRGVWAGVHGNGRAQADRLQNQHDIVYRFLRVLSTIFAVQIAFFRAKAPILPKLPFARRPLPAALCPPPFARRLFPAVFFPPSFSRHLLRAAFFPPPFFCCASVSGGRRIR